MSNANKYIHLLILCLGLAIHVSVTGQTPGMIVKPISGGGVTVLDPDGDGYVSKKIGGVQIGFTGPFQDIVESEIPYVAIIRPDPMGDILRGPQGGFCEIVGVDANGNNAIMVYKNETNIFFRFRLGGYAPNSKSYSLLIDTDGKFGSTGINADPHAVSGNPGFEAEITLETNFNVKAFNVDGANALTPLLVTSESYDTHCQKSIAASMAGDPPDPDYFYDFYLPLSSLTSLFTSSTPLRIVAVTVMNPNGAIANNALSDVGGVTTGSNIDQIFEDLIEAQTPTVPGQEVLDRSDCPMINGPINTNNTTITGSSAEAAGTIIKIYRTRSGSTTTLGQTTVSENTWTYTLVSSLLAGDVITATATASGKGESIGNCNPRTVLAGNAPPCYAPVATGLTMDNPKKVLSFSFVLPNGDNISNYSYQIYDSDNVAWAATQSGPVVSGNTYTYTYTSNSGIKDAAWYVVISHATCLPTRTYYCTGTYSTTPTITGPVGAGSNVSISGTSGSNATVTVYKNNVAVVGSVTATGTTWTKTGLTLAVGDRLYVTSVNGGLCTAVSGNTTVVCSPSITPVINQNVYASDPNLTGTCGSGATVIVYKDGVSIGTATVNGTTWSKGISSLVGNTTTFYVSSTEPGKCEATSSVVTVKTIPVPFISGTYCGSVNSVSGYIPGTTANIQLYKVMGNVPIGALTATDASGNWTISGLNLIAGDEIYATATLPGGSTATSATKAIGSKTTNPVTITTDPIYEGTQLLTGTGINGDVITLYIGDNNATTYTASWSGNTWTISNISPNDLFTGAEVYVTATASGQCEGDPSSTKVVQCVVPSTPSYEILTTPCLGSQGELTVYNTEVGVVYQIINGSGIAQGLEYSGTGGTIIVKTNALWGDLLNVKLKAYKLLNPSCSIIFPTLINFTLPATSPTVAFNSTNLTAIPGATSVSLAYSAKSGAPAIADGYYIDYQNEANAAGLADTPLAQRPLTIGSSPISLTIPGTLPVGTYYGTINISSTTPGTCTTVYPFSITVASAGSPPVIVSQSANSSICSGSTATLNISTSGTVTGIKWQSSATLNGTYTDIPGATLANFTTAALSATTYFKAVVSNANGSVTSNVITVTVSPTVSGTGTIAGTSTVSAGQNGVNYSISGINNATSYIWTYNGTGAFINGTGSSVFINFGTNATSGILSVKGNNTCGSGSAATYSIVVNSTNTITLTSAGGTNTQAACINNAITNITYSTTGANGATFSGLPAGVTGEWALNAVTISGTPTVSSATPYTYTVTLTGGLGTVTATGTITVHAKPNTSEISYD